MHKFKSIQSSAYAASISIGAVTTVTIAAELIPPFKAWLASVTGHHWVTKSWMSILVYVVLFIFFRVMTGGENEMKARNALYTLITTAFGGALALLLFYIYEFASH